MLTPIDRNLALQKTTDLLRWSNVAALERGWDARAKVAARFILPGARVLDLGCGRMALRRFLSEQCSYRGCDLVAREPDTIVCNFNAGEFPDEAAQAADVIVMLGVLEYIVDVDAFLGRLRQAGRHVVISYSPREWSAGIDRAALGWFNALSLHDLALLFARSGFGVGQVVRVDEVQVLVELQPAEADLPVCDFAERIAATRQLDVRSWSVARANKSVRVAGRLAAKALRAVFELGVRARRQTADLARTLVNLAR
jgi:hypothetical protein